MTYYNQIKQLVTQCADFWDYYNIHHYRDIDQFFNEPVSFIKNTFMYASKKLLAPRDEATSDLMYPAISDARAAHSVSTFFLGALIAQKLFEGRFKSLSTDKENKKVYEFSYIWTLTCLYHDCGYTLENNKALTQRLARAVNSAWVHNTFEQRAKKYPHWLGMAIFRREMELRQSIWGFPNYRFYWRNCLNQNSVSLLNCFECRAILDIEEYYRHVPKCLYLAHSATPILFPIRKSSEINRYFAYRLLSVDAPITKRSCIDHGIAGGYLFFDRIIRNYANAYCSASRNNDDTDISEFTNPNDYSERPMHFSFDQLPLFGYIADCIINHNIWSASSYTAYGEIYKMMGMEKLMIPEYDKINFFKNPLLFTLAVSDSIEPYKLFSTPHIDKTSYASDQLKSIFNETCIEIKSDRIVIKPPKQMFDRLQQKLQELQDWVDVDCEKTEDVFEIIPRLAD